MIFFFLLFIKSQSDTIQIIPKTGTSPAARGGSTMVYSSMLQSIVIFGGCDNNVSYNDVWAFSFVTFQWKMLIQMTIDSPGNLYVVGRQYPGGFIVTEDNIDLLYIFGGTGEYGSLKDLWSFDLYSQIWYTVSSFNKFSIVKTFAYTSFEYESLTYFCIYGGLIFDKPNSELFMYVFI